MREFILGLIITIALASCQSGRPPPTTVAGSTGVAVIDWRNCVGQQADRLAFTPGSATKIAETSMGLCNAQERVFISEAIYMNPDLMIRIIPGLREALSQDAAAIVIERRDSKAQKAP
jgi:hypothetical protein